MSDKIPTTEQIREWCADDGGLAEYHDPINGHLQAHYVRKDFNRWLTAYTAKVQADTLRELAEHFNEPGITATSAGSIYIYESREHYDAGRPRPTEIVPWLCARADALLATTTTDENDDETEKRTLTPPIEGVWGTYESRLCVEGLADKPERVLMTGQIDGGWWFWLPETWPAEDWRGNTRWFQQFGATFTPDEQPK